MSRIIVNLCLAVMVSAAYAADDWRLEGASKLNWQDADNICGGYFNYEFNEKTALQEGQRLIADEINLSENKYQGGDLSIYTCGKIDFSEPGDILIFKSFMSHKVDKLLKGSRKTLSIWMEGPCFK